MTGGETTKGKWSGVFVRGGSEGGGGESTAHRDKWGGVPGKEES